MLAFGAGDDGSNPSRAIESFFFFRHSVSQKKTNVEKRLSFILVESNVRV